ncbi:aspartyl aminopeptidase [Wallemia mellicola]|nr:aspartyl aminopeptidase [Wallemia mellicola]TIB92699.1 aspartyl aminopeptidase [Wallemia mellicola]TIC44551.1 aspartyl aminopeptidase [Wallemia mellicola]TIC53618.1 aspartyl aminopeptidase [Wallemia mellicola]
MTAIKSAMSRQAAERFLKFVDASTDPFHATYTAVQALEKAGFKKLHENASWNGQLQAGSKYYFTRNQSSVIAFTLGAKYNGSGGISLIGAHTDSPNLRVKPVSNKTAQAYLQVKCETYGGGIWHSWFDRDLSISGRVIVSEKGSTSKFVSRLVKLDKPILRIPSLAIHLDRDVNPFKFNPETHLIPILGLVNEQLNATTDKEAMKSKSLYDSHPVDKHHPALLEAVAKELDVEVSQIQDFELSLYDTQKAAIGGINDEFILSARQDNLMSCFASIEALIEASDRLENDDRVRCVCLFDHEEVGSASTAGADGSLLPDLIHRLTSELSKANQSKSSFEEVAARSFIISADMAHAVHPNYAEKHDDLLRPKLNGGPVIKTNVKQRYATTSITSFLLGRIAEKVNVPLQHFSVRNDIPCGSTIAPMLASKSGIQTVDIGLPQLSMHSIREMSGSEDPQHLIDLFRSFFEHYGQLQSEITVD